MKRLIHSLVVLETDEGPEAGPGVTSEDTLPSHVIYRLCVTKDLQSPKIAPPPGDEVFKLMNPWGTFHIQTATF